MNGGQKVKIILIVAMVSGIHMISSTTSPKERCESAHPTARYFRGHCFIVGQENSTWIEGKDKCKRFGNGHLAVVSSPKLADYIARNILTPHNYSDSWVGLKQSENPLNEWIWHYKSHNYLSQPSSISIKNFTATSNEKCVTVGKSSPRLKNEDCNLKKNFVCQYAFGGQRFRELKITNKKPAKSSAAISFQATMEQQCTAVCGTSPALSLAYNQATHHCEIYLEFADELELSDAPGYVMLEKEGLESKVLGCVAAESEFLLANATIQMDGSPDFTTIGSHDMTCDTGFYLTEKNTTDNKWYTTYTPPKFVCKDDGTWTMQNTGGKTFKCLNIPDSYTAIYEHYEVAPLYNHYLSTIPSGILRFHGIPSSAYCPEKLPLHIVFGYWSAINNHYYMTSYITAMTLDADPSWTYQGILTYVVGTEGQCGATIPMHEFYHHGQFDYYYKSDTGIPGAGWVKMNSKAAWWGW